MTNNVGKSETAVGEALSLAAALPELNIGNYNHEDVCDLNARVVEVIVAAISALAQVGVPSALPPEVVELMRYRMCMSYNDSYFGEPVGLVKRAIAELERRTGQQPVAQVGGK